MRIDFIHSDIAMVLRVLFLYIRIIFSTFTIRNCDILFLFSASVNILKCSFCNSLHPSRAILPKWKHKLNHKNYLSFTGSSRLLLKYRLRTFMSTFSIAALSSGFLFPAGIYLLKVNNRNTRTRCEICSKLTIKTRRRSGVFIVNFEHFSHLVLVFLLLTLNMWLPTGLFVL